MMPIDRAYHTPLFAHLEGALNALYADLPIMPPRDALYSCATAKRFPDDAAEIRELAARQWFSPVRFRETILGLYEEGVRTFVEVGPGATLTSFVRDTLAKRKLLALATNIPGRSALGQLQRVLAEVFVHGGVVDFSPLYAQRKIADSDGTRESASRETPSRSMVRVPLTMPTLKLPAGFNPGQRTAAEPPVPQAAPDRVTVPIASSVHSPGVVESRRSASVRFAALQSHFETMRHFLAAQERVIAAACQPTPRSRPAAIAVGEPFSVPSSDDATSWPWLGRILERSTTRIKCERVFDLAHDAFLRDHTLGGALSAHDATLLPLSVVPFTAMMEVLAEASHCLVGAGHVVTAMRDVKGHRWLALDHGRLAVVIVAAILTRGDAGRIDVEVTVHPSAAVESVPGLLFEGIVTLKAAFPAVPSRAIETLHEPRASHYTRAMLYADAKADFTRYAPMFHGTYFRAVDRIEAWDEDGIDATLRTRDLGATSPSGPSFQLDPVLLDAAGQLVGYWVAERYGVDLTFFPFVVRRYEQFGEPLPPARVINCRARIRLACDEAGVQPRFEFVDSSGRALAVGPAGSTESAIPSPHYDACRVRPASAFLEADFEFADESGRVIARVQGWRDRYFSIPHAHYRCHLSPQREFFSEPWEIGEAVTVCRRTRSASWSYLDEGWQIWKRALAHLSLTDKERRHWYSLPEKGRRRTEWLIGRVTAKDAVRQWTNEQRGIELAPVDIEILPDTLGRPVVRVPLLGDLGQIPAVSISHRDETTVAIAFGADTARGIDMEVPGRFVASDLQEAFSPGQWEALRARGRDFGDACVRAWCAKEAAAKAAGTGLAGAPADWVVSESSNGQEATVTHERDTYDVRFFREEEIVAAIAVRRIDVAQGASMSAISAGCAVRARSQELGLGLQRGQA